MTNKPTFDMTFDEYYLFQLPAAQQRAPGQPESFYRRQALRNYKNMQNVQRDRVTCLLEQLHKEFPAFGKIRIIDHADSTVMVRNGPKYKGKLRSYRFRFVNARLVYRRKQRQL